MDETRFCLGCRKAITRVEQVRVEYTAGDLRIRTICCGQPVVPNQPRDPTQERPPRTHKARIEAMAKPQPQSRS